MSSSLLIGLGLIAGAGAGFLGGLIGIGGGIVVVPVVYYDLVTAGASANEAAHAAVGSSRSRPNHHGAGSVISPGSVSVWYQGLPGSAAAF